MEGIPLFSEKMDIDVVVDWVDVMENHFDCKGVTKAQKVKVSKSRLRGSTLEWWKYVQYERVSEGKKPISNWKAMVTKLRENFLPEDYKIQLHKMRQGLKQKDMDVSSYIEEF